MRIIIPLFLLVFMFAVVNAEEPQEIDELKDQQNVAALNVVKLQAQADALDNSFYIYMSNYVDSKRQIARSLRVLQNKIQKLKKEIAELEKKKEES